MSNFGKIGQSFAEILRLFIFKWGHLQSCIFKFLKFLLSDGWAACNSLTLLVGQQEGHPVCKTEW